LDADALNHTVVVNLRVIPARVDAFSNTGAQDNGL